MIGAKGTTGLRSIRFNVLQVVDPVIIFFDAIIKVRFCFESITELCSSTSDLNGVRGYAEQLPISQLLFSCYELLIKFASRAERLQIFSTK